MDDDRAYQMDGQERSVRAAARKKAVDDLKLAAQELRSVINELLRAEQTRVATELTFMRGRLIKSIMVLERDIS